MRNLRKTRIHIVFIRHYAISHHPIHSCNCILSGADGLLLSWELLDGDKTHLESCKGSSNKFHDIMHRLSASFREDIRAIMTKVNNSPSRLVLFRMTCWVWSSLHTLFPRRIAKNKSKLCNRTCTKSNCSSPNRIEETKYGGLYENTEKELILSSWDWDWHFEGPNKCQWDTCTSYRRILDKHHENNRELRLFLEEYCHFDHTSARMGR